MIEISKRNKRMNVFIEEGRKDFTKKCTEEKNNWLRTNSAPNITNKVIQIINHPPLSLTNTTNTTITITNYHQLQQFHPKNTTKWTNKILSLLIWVTLIINLFKKIVTENLLSNPTYKSSQLSSHPTTQFSPKKFIGVNRMQQSIFMKNIQISTSVFLLQQLDFYTTLFICHPFTISCDFYAMKTVIMWDLVRFISIYTSKTSNFIFFIKN